MELIQIQRTCQECPCKDLLLLQEEIKELRSQLESQITLILVDGAKDRKRITRVEKDIIDFKGSFAQITAARSDGTWGIAQKRGDLIYARLLSMRNGNGKNPFLSIGDVKQVLGLSNYSQVRAAIYECIRKHLDVKSVERGRSKIGLELLSELPTPVLSEQTDIMKKDKLW